MRRGLFGFTLLSVLLADCDAPSAQGDPGLVVLVVVDQMRADLPERLAPALSGGFRRLSERGASFPNTVVPYALSNSGPGHATIATGMLPTHHGIVDNGWVERTPSGSWAYRSAFADSTVHILDDPAEAGVSPATRLATSLGDWAMTANDQSRVLVIGQGPVSSNSLAPFAGADTYWFAPNVPGFVTSSYFRTELPEWVSSFNRETLSLLMVDTLWTPSVPQSLRAMALPDDVAWEGGPGVGTFPHHPSDVSDAGTSPARWFTGTPGIDEATLLLAERGVEAMELGRRGPVDVLLLNLSSLDEAGHSYGPESLEQMDAVFRVDAALGRFMDFLDRHVGAKRWVMAVTADHGSADPPERLRAQGRPGTRISLDEVTEVFGELFSRTRSLSGDEAQGVAVRFLMGLPYVEDVYTVQDLENGDDPWTSLYGSSFRPDRRLDFPLYDPEGRITLAELDIGAVRLSEGTIVDFAVSVHGSPYMYDRRVPLYVVGPGVTPGVRQDTVTLADVAPTLATLGFIPVPDGLDGAAVLRHRH